MNPKPIPLETTRINKLPAPPEPPAPAAPPDPGAPLTAEQLQALRQQVVAALSNVFDPEIPVNIYELGLIYDIDIKPSGAVGIRMTLTSPGCPVAGSLPGDVEAKVRRVPGVASAVLAGLCSRVPVIMPTTIPPIIGSSRTPAPSESSPRTSRK